MIVVVFNKPDFEYDVHSLLKEFFPQEDVQMYYSCSPDEVEGKNLACTHHEMTDDGVKEFADASQVFKIDYVGDEIAVEWTLNRAGEKVSAQKYPWTAQTARKPKTASSSLFIP